MQNLTPSIETDRLRLRGHRIDDLPACARMWADPAVVRFIGGQPNTPQQVWGKIMTYRGHWELMGYGYWAVVDRETDQYMGEMGFADFKREIGDTYKNLPELGWALSPEFHGQGFATEGLRAILEWGDSRWKRTFCIISPGNLASIRVAGKLGYTERDSIELNGEPIRVFTREK